MSADFRPAPVPAAHAALSALPLGAIRPAGWLLDQLRLQADGLTGHLEDLWADVGPDSAWLGGPGEDWERGPYYLDGLVPLAHVLADAPLQGKAQRWIEALLASQRHDGGFGPLSNDDPWPRMVALKALTQHFEATGDPRVVPFITRYLRRLRAELTQRPLVEWGRARGGEGALSALWLHRHTGEDWLLELARAVLAQTTPWEQVLSERLTGGPTESFDHTAHVVNVAMGLKLPALRLALDGDPGHLSRLHTALSNLDAHHALPNGMFSGDEWLAGRAPHHGVETCAVVECMFSLEVLARAFGHGWLGDRLEQVAFNALAAACGADMRTHQYHQQVNQVQATIAQRDWTFSGDDANIFGLEPHFGCCTANLHQGWPKFTASLWAQAEDGLAVLAYAPCEVNAQVKGVRVQLTVDTTYPFEDTVRVRVGVDGPTAFALHLRVPGWCAAPALTVNADPWPASAPDHGYLRVQRTWQAGDLVSLHLPMRPRLEERTPGALSVHLGPLTLALWPGELWSRLPDSAGFGDWELRPRRSWNWALSERDVANWCVERGALATPPFAVSGSLHDAGAAHTPLRVRARARRVPEWRLLHHSAGPLPDQPIRATLPLQDVQLVPYGAARLRVAEFPRLLSDDPADLP